MQKRRRARFEEGAEQPAVVEHHRVYKRGPEFPDITFSYPPPAKSLFSSAIGEDRPS